MPPYHNRKVGKRIPAINRNNWLSYSGRIRFANREEYYEQVVPSRIAKSPHGAILIAYVARALMDRAEGHSLTKLQTDVITPLVNQGLDIRFRRRFTELPSKVRRSFDPKVFALPNAQDVDQLLIERLKMAAGQLSEMQEVGINQVLVDGGFRSLFVTSLVDRVTKKWKDIDWSKVPAGPPDMFNFSLEYRGLSVLTGGDRWGGVDPYYISGFFVNPCGTEQLLAARRLFKLKHQPDELGETGTDFWHPYSGDQDEYGNPRESMPVFQSGRPLSENDRNFALLSVWEEDGDQAAEIMEVLGTQLIQVGSALLAVCPVAGAIVIVVGSILDLASLLVGSEDDHVNDILLLFDKDDLNLQRWRELPAQATAFDGSQDWILYFGVNSAYVSPA